MIGRAALGAKAARRPLVIKLTTDEAYERAQRRGFYDGDLDAFQHAGGNLHIRALRRSRDAALRQATRVVCPSSYLREIAVAWGVPADRVLVIPNPAPDLPRLPTRDEARKAVGVSGPTLAFAGRIGRQKALEVGLEAVARVAGVSLLVAGDGPEREEMERRAGELRLGGRVRFLGSLPREDVLRLFRAADASLLSSTWENFPHTVVESLAVGTPVIATSVGGVPEVVKDGENGLLVPSGDAGVLAAAIHRFYGERGLREQLAAAAAPSVAGYRREETLARIEAALAEAAA
jgi:glycosyltransferase involved in cell wall biosynthesis